MKKLITVFAVVFAVSACNSTAGSNTHNMENDMHSEKSYHNRGKKWSYTPEEKFSKIDENNNNTVSYEEFEAYYQEKKEDKNCPMSSKEMFKSADSNGDEKLTLEEFRSWKSDRMEHKRMKKKMHKNKSMSY